MTVLMQIINLLSDRIARTPEDISISLNIKLKTIQQTLWRDNARSVRRFKIKPDKHYFYHSARKSSDELRREIAERKYNQIKQELDIAKSIIEKQNKRIIELQKKL